MQKLQLFKTFMLVALLSFSSSGFSQVTEAWIKRYDGSGNFYDETRSLTIDASSNVYITGTLDNDCVTIKYDAVGNEQWVQRYSAPGNGKDVGYSLAVDAAGNVYVTAFSGGNGKGVDYVTIKYDVNGAERWVRRYNGPGNSDDLPYKLVVDGVGNVYVTGYSVGSGTDYDYATLKYDAAGNQQ